MAAHLLRFRAALARLDKHRERLFSFPIRVACRSWLDLELWGTAE
jgi:hypothetical protein